MKRLKIMPSRTTVNGQAGFIPMILTIIIVLAAVMFFAYRQVIQAQQ